MSSSTDSNPWEIRAARNQSLFRAINDELRAPGASGDGDSLTVACECADVDCVETLEITAARYAEIRREPTHFVVLPGHVYPEVEKLIAEESDFVVVEKIGEAARVAAASDGMHSDA